MDRGRRLRSGAWGVILLLALLLLTGASWAQAPLIAVNGRPLYPDVPPRIEDGHTLVPLRVIAEGLGFNVDWSDATGVTMTRGEMAINLWPGSRKVRVGGQTYTLPIASRLERGRTLAPLRFISEQIGAQVMWDEAEELISITTADGATRPKVAQLPPLGSLARLPFGAGYAEVARAWGEPSRQEAGIYGLTWWVYDPNPTTYLRAGFFANRLVMVKAFGDGWQHGPLAGGVATGAARQALGGFGDEIATTLDGVEMDVRCDYGGGRENSLHAYPGYGLVVFLDRLDEKVVGALAADLHYFFASDPLTWVASTAPCTLNWRGGGSEPVFLADRPGFYAHPRAEVNAGLARSFVELTNVSRRQRGLDPYAWSAGAAQAAAVHVNSMATRGYYGHQSPYTGSPADRLRAAGVKFSLASESIAHDYLTALGNHVGWLNSPTHREAELHPGFTHIGAAYEFPVSAKKFYRPQ